MLLSIDDDPTKLRSGTPFWLTQSAARQSFPDFGDSTNCEVLVIGGGITGGLVAHLLVKAGVDTVLVDKHDPGIGSTAASTGLLQYEIDTPLHELIPKVGEARAVHAYRRGLWAIDELGKLCSELSDECAFSSRNSLYFAAKKRHERSVRTEYECRQHYGFDVRWLGRRDLADITTIKSPGAIVSLGNAQVNPFQLTQHLFQQSLSDGLRAYGNSEIRTVSELPEGIRAELADDQRFITAKKVVFAAGYETDTFLPQHVGDLQSTYALVSEPLAAFSGWPDNNLIWESSDPYFYARQTEDGRAMIGGEDTPFSRDHQKPLLMHRQFHRLRTRFTELFPWIDFEPAYGWAGTFGRTKDGMAYIGTPAGRPHSYFAMGYGGNGITFSMIAARLITDHFLGKPNFDAEVFAFDR